MSTAALSSLLPAPRHTLASVTVEEEEEEDFGPTQVVAQSSSQATRPYGQRRGWKPREQADFGDGGAFPECHIAQYPLEMGRKKSVSLSTRLSELSNVKRN